MRFKKDTRIIHIGKKYQCIIADEEIAVFGELYYSIDENGVEYDRVDYASPYIVSQIEDDFDWEIIK